MNRHLARTASLALIVMMVGALVAPALYAAPRHKAGIAPDLREATRKEAPQNEARVVATLEGGDAESVIEQVAKLGGHLRGHYRHAEVMVLDLPLEQVEALAETEGVRYLAPDREVTVVASLLDTTTGASQVLPSLLNLSGYNGRGVGIAVVDSGVAGSHLDLAEVFSRKSRLVLAVDFNTRGRTDDSFGHGTHVAGIIAGDNSAARWVGSDYTGLAPAANIISLRVLDDRGRGYLSDVVAAIDYAIGVRALYNIRVLNLSLAAPPVDSYLDDPLCQAVARAAAAGIVVVAASGNFGQDESGNVTYGSITSPGISPAAITVGASDSRGTAARSDDVVAPFSSRGPTLSHRTDEDTDAVTYDLLAKPDLVAPGVRITSLERDDNYLVKRYPVLHADGQKTNGKYMTLSGTSMSTAVVSGAAALMLQANPSLTPNMVKAILMYTAQMMEGPDLFSQGAGLLNVEGAVRLAASLSRSASTLQVGDSLLAGSGLPAAESTVAGETFAWSQGLIWGFGLLRGVAIVSSQQEAYAQALIWGTRRLDVWGAGVTYYDGLYSENHVAFAQNGDWKYITWDTGTPTASGLIWTRQLDCAGLIWGNRVISNDFFDMSSSSLIWGILGYGRYASSLIWGIRLDGDFLRVSL